jgi:hypothetical protein
MMRLRIIVKTFNYRILRSDFGFRIPIVPVPVLCVNSDQALQSNVEPYRYPVPAFLTDADPDPGLNLPVPQFFLDH